MVCCILSSTLLISGCGGGADSTEYKQCVAQGLAYYKEIGSYPKLTTGEMAEVKIGRLCRQNVEMFKLFD